MPRTIESGHKAPDRDLVLVRLDAARKALAEARTIQETKAIADIARAAEVYAKRQKLAQQAIDSAHAIHVEALRKLGQILKAGPKAKGTRGQLKGTKDGSGATAVIGPEPERAPSYASVGLDYRTASTAQRLAGLPNGEFAKVRDGKVTVQAAIRGVRQQELAVRLTIPPLCAPPPLVDLPSRRKGSPAAQPPAGRALAGPRGKTTSVRSLRSIGLRYESVYRIVALDSLIVSHRIVGSWSRWNPEYPSEIQPRDRERFRSGDEGRAAACLLDPARLLWDSPMLAHGAPIVWRDCVVESGNMRCLILRVARDEFPERWREYQRALHERLADLGFEDDALNGIEEPVLVRERLTEVADRVGFAREANESEVEAYSPRAGACIDADRLSDHGIGRIEPSATERAERDIMLGANSKLAGELIWSLPHIERTTMLPADGEISKDSVARLIRALFVRTYEGPDAAEFEHWMFEDRNPVLKHLRSALLDSLLWVATAEALIRMGLRETSLALARDLMAASIMVFDALGEDVSMEQYLAQSRLCGRAYTKFQARLACALYALRGSAARLRVFIQSFARAVRGQDQRGQGTFELRPTPSREDILNRAIADTAKPLDSRGTGRQSGRT